MPPTDCDCTLHEQQHDDHSTAPSCPVQADCTVGKAHDHQASSPHAALAGPTSATGWDCYVVQEPCAMCAMALVHARLGRVVYALQDAAHGALGGRFRLHSQRSLNHHYLVYRLAPED